MLRVWGRVLMVAASWTDRTLLESGWYPPEANRLGRGLPHVCVTMPQGHQDYSRPPRDRASGQTERDDL
jgi:hypothetical protein